MVPLVLRRPRRGCLPAAVLAAALLGAAPAGAASVEETREAVDILSRFIAIPTVSDDTDGVRRGAEWLIERFEALGLEARLLPTSGNPLVFAERAPETRSFTVLFYMHYDTQPTGSPEDWRSTSGDPFSPALLSGRWDETGAAPLTVAGLSADSIREARLYGRGSADDKAPIVMHLMALGRRPREDGGLHVKFLLDGEEEAGSPHIAEALERHGDLLRADLLVLCDGPMDAGGRPSVYLGTRGDMHMRLRVRTAGLPAHSGNYSLLPSAAWRLNAILASMRDAEGNVLIEGFMDDVAAPTPAERAVLAEASTIEPIIARGLGVARFEGDPAVPYFERLLFSPALIINHVASGRPGNQIPVEAEALLEVRLVPSQDPVKVYETVKRHVKALMPEADLEYLGGSRAGRMDPSDPAVARGIAAAREAAGDRLLVYPSLGGTLPLLHAFTRAGHRYLGLPLVNFDNNQHVGNENVRVQALGDGIETLERFYEALEGDQAR